MLATPALRSSLLSRIAMIPFRGFLQPLSYRYLAGLLRDPEVRRWTTHTLSNQLAMTEARFSSTVPSKLESIGGFEDCTWLLSSNELNHGLARQRLDELAYLYRLVQSYGAASVAELGYYKGGSTFLMAAAGANVLAIDNGRVGGQQALVPDLVAALERFGLDERVDIVDADAADFAVIEESFDLVFFDCMYSYDLCARIFERWWPAVRRNGVFLFRDGKDSLLTDAVRYVKNLDPASLGAESDPSAPGAFVAFRKR